MNFFWVNVGQTSDEVFKKSFLWAPLYSKPRKTESKTSSQKNSHTHWRVVSTVRKGDIIFGNAKQHLVFIAVATKDSFHATCPPGRAFSSWHALGNQVDIKLFELPVPVSIKGEIEKSFVTRHNKTSSSKIFTIKGTVFQGYLAALSDAAGLDLLSYIGDTEATVVEESNKLQSPDGLYRRPVSKPVGATTKQAVREARIGQGYFRQQLLDMWKACPVTGVSEPSLLLASHTKPWAKSDDNERLDPYNGFLFAPHIDRLFDKGFIGFSDDGAIIISSLLNASDRAALGINPHMKIPVHQLHKRYLAAHRDLFSLA